MPVGVQTHAHLALADQRHAFVAGYLEPRPEVPARSIETYENLTLARHVSISSELEGRGRHTPALLELCERRLQLDS